MFKKDDSLALKGVAILMMLWHHCFLEGRFESYDISFWPISTAQAVNIASFFKLCVSLFAFISGYGLYLSLKKEYERASAEHPPRIGPWVGNRLVKTLSGFWFIVILAWIVCFLADRLPVTVYFSDADLLSGLLNAVLDFLGVAYLFNQPVLIATWWYMSAAVVYILLAPLMFRLTKFLGALPTLGLCFVLPRILNLGYTGEIEGFLTTFYVGMVFASLGLFERWHSWKPVPSHSNFSNAVRFLLSLFSIYLAYKLYLLLNFTAYWDIKRAVLPIPLILFCVEYLVRLPGVRQILGFLGKHSMNIFLVHSFFRSIYAADFVYGFHHAFLIALVLLGISLAVSIVIEQLKHLLHYNEFINRLIQHI